MHQYYSVETKVYDDGRVECQRAGTKSFNEHPEGTCVGLPGYDYYLDWFRTPAEAEAFVKEALLA